MILWLGCFKNINLQKVRSKIANFTEYLNFMSLLLTRKWLKLLENPLELFFKRSLKSNWIKLFFTDISNL